MIRGLNVQCLNCNKRYNVYEDIQRKVHGRLVGVCPHCNEVNAHEPSEGFTFDYNNGDVNPHLEGDPVFDWDGYGKHGYEDNPYQQVADAFDMDVDVAKSNLGWED